MKRSLIVLCLVLGFAHAQDAAPKKEAAPQQPADFASLLPANTLLMFEGDDLGGFEHWSKETAVGRIFMEPEMQAFFKKAFASVENGLNFGAGMLGMVGLQLSDFSGLELRRFGFAVVDGGVVQGRPNIDAVLTMQMRKGGDKLKKIVDAARQGLVNFLGVPFNRNEIGGWEIWDTQFQVFNFFFAVKGDRLLVTTNRERMTQLIDALANGNKTSLETAPRYANLIKRMGAERSAMIVYADVKGLYEKGVALARQFERQRNVDQFVGIWNTLGLDTVDAIGIADIPAGTGYRTELAITHTGRKGVFKLASPGQVNHRFARYAPARCFCYSAEHWEAEPGLRALIDIVLAFEPGAKKEIDLFLAEFKKHSGVDFEKDIIKSLGADWASYIGAPEGGGLIPDIVVFVTVRDRERLEKSLDMVAQKVVGMVREKHNHIALRTTEFRGLKIRVLESADFPVPLAWAFGKDYMVIGLTPQMIKNAHVEKPSLAGNEEFRKLMRSVPQGAASASWLNLKDVTGWLYNTAVPVLQATQGMANRELQMFGVTLNFHDLPPAETILKHLSGAMTYTSPEEGCLRMGYVSPLGSSLMGVAVGAGVGAAAVVFLAEKESSRARRGMRRAEAEHGVAVERTQVAELQQRLRVQRQKYETRVKAIEKQIADLKKIIEEIK